MTRSRGEAFGEVPVRQGSPASTCQSSVYPVSQLLPTPSGYWEPRRWSRNLGMLFCEMESAAGSVCGGSCCSPIVQVKSLCESVRCSEQHQLQGPSPLCPPLCPSHPNPRNSPLCKQHGLWLPCTGPDTTPLQSQRQGAALLYCAPCVKSRPDQTSSKPSATQSASLVVCLLVCSEVGSLAKTSLQLSNSVCNQG